MNYEEALRYIKNYRSGGISLGLDRMRLLCSYLGDPQNKLRFVHVAGTNGKGSTSAYISSILAVNGCLVGRYVSPVVFQYEECIQFEDSRGTVYIEKELLADVITEAAHAVERIEREGGETPTIFEFETAMAFLAFVKKQCQIVVLEVGLGGREDATNVIEHVVASVITPISRDHMRLLGNTLAEIAAQKAGIIRKGVPVITIQKEPEVLAVISSVCRDRKATLTVVNREDIKLLQYNLKGSLFSYQGEHFRTQMLGIYQLDNACLAIETCRQMENEFSFDPVQFMLGIRETKWHGRLELVKELPTILVDGAHNEQGALALRESLEKLLPGNVLHGVMGVFRDKEYYKMVTVLQPLFYDIITVTAPTDRGLEAEVLADVWRNAGCKRVSIADSVSAGVNKAAEHCSKGEAVVLFGSLSLLGQLTIEK